VNGHGPQRSIVTLSVGAAALGDIERTRISVLDVRDGSVVVEFAIAPAGARARPPAAFRPADLSRGRAGRGRC
jgi:hypothetical protein